jgi:hypothetical protein
MEVADVAPKATITLGGTVTAALLLTSVTIVFPEEGALRLTVQFEVAPLAMLVGLQVRDETCVVAVTATEIVVWAVPLKDAVSVAVWAVAELAVARNVAEVAPEGTVTLGGTVTAALLLERVTTVLPEAAALRFTVQFDVAPLAMLVGPQVRDVTCVVAVTVTEIVVCAVPL